MLALALADAERNQHEPSRAWLERLRRRFPDSVAARKAAVLAAG
jgi:TolA-binding protein